MHSPDRRSAPPTPCDIHAADFSRLSSSRSSPLLDRSSRYRRSSTAATSPPSTYQEQNTFCKVRSPSNTIGCGRSELSPCSLLQVHHQENETLPHIKAFGRSRPSDALAPSLKQENSPEQMGALADAQQDTLDDASCKLRAEEEEAGLFAGLGKTFASIGDQHASELHSQIHGKTSSADLGIVSPLESMVNACSMRSRVPCLLHLH